MTTWGLGALIAGFIWSIVAYNMSTCALIEQRCVENIFLIAARESHLRYGYLLMLVGIVFTVLGIIRSVYKRKTTKAA
ncbi:MULTISPECIES: hypothetical protein [Enterobacteriaceae]|uniref:hypothetical protein n=1 Tax=Enterobacteriaceae TaxID=543 RepID=UPI000272B067|nr:hypothetical protein [Enterobacter sp. Ag1]EJF31696.1 hypothetical protein A936_08888 [Enterobacter sp. Ag1]